jgi:hypothetical protein
MVGAAEASNLGVKRRREDRLSTATGVEPALNIWAVWNSRGSPRIDGVRAGGTSPACPDPLPATLALRRRSIGSPGAKPYSVSLPRGVMRFRSRPAHTS